ncbi:hypothetical protein RJ641_013249, partial [Dillenia turbinata]
MRKKEQEGTLNVLNETMKKKHSVSCHLKLTKETAGPQGKKVEELEEMREDDSKSKMLASWIPVTPAKTVLSWKQSHDQNCPLLYYQRKKSKKSASLNYLLALAAEEACTSSKSVEEKPCEAGTSSYHVSCNHGFTVLPTSPPENHKIALKGKGDNKKKKKKGHSLPKVDLDPETKAYEMPMGKADNGIVEQEAWKENEKKLEKDRELFRGRVQSFTAHMHLILGNRKFSSWKGSVMDSVVGAFLSQNVSDQSSRQRLLYFNSAFMMLASKYPLQPTLKKACHGDEGLANYAESSGVKECALRDTLSGLKRKHSVALKSKRKKGNLRAKGVKVDREHSDRLDSVDWESIRHADTKDVANAIQVRGMNSRLAERIKNFLDRVVKDHREIDLEWLRKVPAHKVNAKLALPAPQDTRVLGTKTSTLSEPIIDELTSRTPLQIVVPDSESDIEDLFSQENDGIPIIKLDIETFKGNLKELMEQKNILIEGEDMSRALVAVEDASIPVPNMKNESRLRTEWRMSLLMMNPVKTPSVFQKNHYVVCRQEPYTVESPQHLFAKVYQQKTFKTAFGKKGQSK